MGLADGQKKPISALAPGEQLFVPARLALQSNKSGRVPSSYDVVPSGVLHLGQHALLVVARDSTSTVLQSSEILSIAEVVLPGYAAPLVVEGSLVVEGVLVSSYALLSKV